MVAPVFNQTKFDGLVLYIALKLESDPAFGAVKLNKVLFYSDFLAYGNLGRSITGATYVKMHHGPVPRQLEDAKERLRAGGDAALRTSVVAGGYVQKRLLTLRDPDLGTFTAKEISLVDAMIEHCRALSATELSTFSHASGGWRLSEFDQEIPYATVCLPDGETELTEAEVDFGRQVASRIDAPAA